MAGINSIFNIGRLALFANQRALSVTSQNIANVSTPGYSRQEAVYETTSPVNGQPGQIGTGVQITEIRRLVNQFVENQITSEQSNLGRLQVEESILGRVEAVFSDVEGTGINQALSDFFGALQDLSNNPQGRSERVVLVERANSLVQQFMAADAQLQQVREDLDTEIRGVITTINTLSTQIADLNEQISQVELSGQRANDLRDERGRLLNEMSGIIDIRTLEDNLGRVTVMVAGGKPLVETLNAFALRAVVDLDNSGFVRIEFDAGTGSTTDITGSITNGKLMALVNLRDTLVPGYMGELNRLAASVINQVNQQHQAGYGLDGSTGLDFFSSLAPTVSGLSTNTGPAVVGAAVSDPSSLTMDNYELTFSGGNYTLTNMNTGASITGAYVDPTTITFEGIDVTISGAAVDGDLFRISAHEGAAGLMTVAITDSDQIAASSLLAGLPGDNGNALLLAQLQVGSVTALGSATFQTFYSGFTGTIGARSQLAQNSLSAQELIMQQLSNMREETSGVSLDEEVTHLIMYQRAYEAAAKVISMADELLQTILAMKR